MAFTSTKCSKSSSLCFLSNLTQYVVRRGNQKLFNLLQDLITKDLPHWHPDALKWQKPQWNAIK